MKKILIIIIALVFLSPCVFAEEYTIRPQFPDLNPGDGFFERGSWQNPYVIENQRGREIGTIRSQFPDLDPNDGFMDSGTWQNPYVVDTD